MKTKKPQTNVIVLFLFLLFLGMTCLNGSSEDSLSELENFLETAEIITAIPDENIGRTMPWRIELDDGTVKRKTFFKHISRCRPHVLPDCYKYEIAAYELSKLLELNIVPPTVFREIKGIPGSLQLFVEGCVSLQTIKRRNIKLPDQEMFDKSMYDIHVFENLTYCPCSEEDTLVHLEDGKVCRVDFSEAFAPHHQLIPECTVTQCSQELLHSLKALGEEELKACLACYLNDEEIEALIVRKDLILEALDKE